MDCNCNQRSAGVYRPQMPPPPCMNTNCGCQQPAPMPPIQPRVMESPCKANCPAAGMPSPLRPGGKDLADMPIAMAYVPWQQWRQTYPMEQALSRGTIFPELDLPFVMGRCR